MDDHVSLESLFLHKTFEAHVALVGPYVGVDEDVTFHVGQQGELTATDATLVLLYALWSKRMWKKCSQQMSRSAVHYSGLFKRTTSKNLYIPFKQLH